jgi:hypothetical protein
LNATSVISKDKNEIQNIARCWDGIDEGNFFELQKFRSCAKNGAEFKSRCSSYLAERIGRMRVDWTK